jgi:hypothetical protein
MSDRVKHTARGDRSSYQFPKCLLQMQLQLELIANGRVGIKNSNEQLAISIKFYCFTALSS